MGTKYTSQTQSGYNASPPPDDGSTGVTNLITWSGLKTKLADPTLTLAQNINTALTNALDFSSRTTAVNDTATSADHMKTIECTAALTAKVPTSASVGAGFIVSYKNTSASNVTVGLVTATDTLDGTVNGTITLAPNYSLTVKSNLSGTGYYSIAGFFGASGGTASFSTLTTSGLYTANAGITVATGDLLLTSGNLYFAGGTNYIFGSSGNGTLGTVSFTDVSGRAIRANTGTAGGFGHGSGNQSVAQLTNKSTAVTLAKFAGRIIMNNELMAAGSTRTFKLTASNLNIFDPIFMAITGGIATSDSYLLRYSSQASGVWDITITNNTAGNLSEAVVISFVVIQI